ncbi:hypothetical protein BJ973_000537 [Actinoplanes tereljensis]|uniref:Uncharacterized protein n=1 Tax=Paractinoplanes tereljensis TaxID=571912 RepID=A0A919TWB1_9ACTN|nr:hypothetical protein [Actinoplanes tereljensis]GIF23105.1 hypothetical protein Ate02nite_58350 [Actinoplanes tereljensis]
MSSAEETATVSGNRYRLGGGAGPAAPRIPNQRQTLMRPLPAVADDISWLRGLAKRGELSSAIAAGLGPRLCRAAFAVSHQIVFDVVTRRLELSMRGHSWCARGIQFMDGQCLDGYYDDVESVIDYLLAAKKPIDDLEAWLAHWAPNATVDGHRRRRGARGALQRPRMTRGLATDLGGDPWLGELALKILEWVGVPAGAGASLWPLDRWAQMRAERTRDVPGSTPAQVAIEVDQVLAAMRHRPRWYQDYVERPLGFKVAQVGPPPGDEITDPRPLVMVGPEEIVDARLSGLAGIAVVAIRDGIEHHRDPTETVVEVLTQLFLAGPGSDELDRAPATGADNHHHMSALLADPVALGGIVDRVLRVVRDEPLR